MMAEFGVVAPKGLKGLRELMERLGVRLAGLFPELMQPALRSSVVPPEAVAAQQSKK